MTIYTFIRECLDLWPGKELSTKQQEFYGIKMSKFTAPQVSQIFDWLTENSKYFPRIADIFEAARHCGFTDVVKPYKPHEWEPNDCRMCGGSGMLAVFYEQLFDPKNGYRQLELRRVMQYQSSEPTMRTQPWTRYYYRCCCPLGEVSTLDRGIPQWSGERPNVLKIPLQEAAS